MMENTDKLKSDLIKLESDSSALEKKVKTVDDDLIYVHEKLAIPETLHDRLSTLDSNLKLASDLLGVMRIIPPISTAASNTKRVIDLFREPVNKAKKVSGNIDKRVKPLRTKVHEVEQAVARLDAELQSVIEKEQALIQSVSHAQVCIVSLPSGAVKSESTAGLEALSQKADPPVVKTQQAQHVVLEAANTVESKIKQVKKSIKSLLEIDAAIDRVMKALDPLIRQLQAVKKAFSQIIRVPYGGFPKMCTKKVWPGVKVHYPCGWYPAYFSFSIQQILDGVSGVIKPVMDLLDKAMYAVLNPLLKALNLNIKLPGIPGLENLKENLDALLSVFDPMNQAFDRLRREAQALNAQMQSLFEFTRPFSRIYQACVHGRDQQPTPVGLVLDETQADTDPAIFDAMATLNEQTYLFRSQMYWHYSPGQDEAEGPFAISDLLGTDDSGQSLSGPFDAACAVDGRLSLFQGNHCYLCTPGENSACHGPLEIKGNWGQTAKGQILSGPFSAAFSIDGRVYLFQGDQFYISTTGVDVQAEGPHPIKGNWGVDNEATALDGPFDAATLSGDRIYIRKGESFWDQPVNTIKALN
jgi:hypothetical protein